MEGIGSGPCAKEGSPYSHNAAPIAWAVHLCWKGLAAIRLRRQNQPQREGLDFIKSGELALPPH